jgi:hypothetical protein
VLFPSALTDRFRCHGNCRQVADGNAVLSILLTDLDVEGMKHWNRDKDRLQEFHAGRMNYLTQILSQYIAISDDQNDDQNEVGTK